jgi:hypothetical protein
MTTTLSVRSSFETAETLARRDLDKFYASWSILNLIDRLISVAYSTTVTLEAATTYFISADPLATVVVGWIFNSNTVEVPVNQFTIIAPPATPYLRNTSTSSTSNPIPVKVIAIS